MCLFSAVLHLCPTQLTSWLGKPQDRGRIIRLAGWNWLTCWGFFFFIIQKIWHRIIGWVEEDSVSKYGMNGCDAVSRTGNEEVKCGIFNLDSEMSSQNHQLLCQKCLIGWDLIIWLVLPGSVSKWGTLHKFSDQSPSWWPCCVCDHHRSSQRFNGCWCNGITCLSTIMCIWMWITCSKYCVYILCFHNMNIPHDVTRNMRCFFGLSIPKYAKTDKNI